MEELNYRDLVEQLIEQHARAKKISRKRSHLLIPRNAIASIKIRIRTRDRAIYRIGLSLCQRLVYNTPMAAKDIFHQTVRTALEKEGWTITHDPLFVKASQKFKAYIDLGAEKLLTAEKDRQKIAVEIKSFLGMSSINEFHYGRIKLSRINQKIN